MKSKEPPAAWMKDKPDTFKHHLENPKGLDYPTYQKERRLAFGSEVLEKPRIYLDTKYWVYLRDAELNRPQKEIHTDVLRSVRASRKAGVIFPFSYPLYSELLYQTDLKTRRATALLIDELSQGATLLPPHEVFAREFYHFLRKTISPESDLYDVAQMIWTRTSYVIGDVYPTNEGMPQELLTAIQKAMDDAIWETSLSEMLELIPNDSGLEKSRQKRLAELLTEGKFEDQRQNDLSLDELFVSEVQGASEAYQDTISDVLEQMELKTTGRTSNPSQKLKNALVFCNVIAQAMKHKKLTQELPAIYVPSLLHALVRFDQKRKYRTGDAVDFLHASIAVPYCNAFLTESSLKHLLCDTRSRCHEVYDCVILSNEHEVLNYLDNFSLDQTEVPSEGN